jgi:hypothetical protein
LQELTYKQVPIAICWNIAEFITLAVNKKGIHPGAHIALDLIILTIYSVSSSFDVFLTYDVDLAIAASVFIGIAGYVCAIMFLNLPPSSMIMIPALEI